MTVRKENSLNMTILSYLSFFFFFFTNKNDKYWCECSMLYFISHPDLRETPCSPDTSQLILSADSAPIVSARCPSGPQASEDDLIRVQVKGASRTQPNVEALQSATFTSYSSQSQTRLM